MQRIRDLTINYRAVISAENLEEVTENIETAVAISEQGGKWHEVSIRPPRRSNPQNDYFHTLLRDIATATGHSVEEVKHFCKAEYLGYDTVVIRGIPIARPRETSGLTEVEMTELITRTEVLHADLI